ncbi:peptide-methionine (R)-S-oxide reductase MsrB [Candidatus Sumerlaeota bacterium]|nr:peptide-methionine (R)-S-oxide reductase MsrB [Candidatus Sumerlaeota bacterium]
MDPKPTLPKIEKLVLSEAEWRKRLTPEQYHVLREKGTERACTGALWKEKRQGVYVCAGCGLELFRSGKKFESGTGWPSFWDPLPGSVENLPDNSLGMERTEVNCARCGGHLGHVFEDGPPPTGLRYCMNSAAMRFVEDKTSATQQQ